MTFIIFLIILSILVFVHELGHFLVAKKAGVFVEEFGFGYPPRAVTLGKRWGTLFSINWIPFGGFVKIFGENYEENDKSPQEKFSSEKSSGSLAPLGQTFSSENFPEGSKKLNFTQISKKWQAAILVAGVTFNILFAWILFSVGFMIGLPTPVENDFGKEVRDPALTITGLLPGAPAEKSGLKTGDKIKNLFLENGVALKDLNSENVSDFINKSEGKITVAVDRGGKDLSFEVIPSNKLVENKKIIGINMEMVGTLSLPIHQALIEGARVTYRMTLLTILGLWDLVVDTTKGEADMSSVTGPVGIVGLVGDASRLGFTYLLTFTALISINLAIINLVPFPALDGGRLLFVGIEAITRKKINPKFAQITNTVSFALLIALMLFVTYRDILKLF